MSILIRGVDAPKSCFDCKYITLFKKLGENRCSLLSLAVIKDGAHCRLSDCPIKELPPHGRLIDADKLRHKWKALKDGMWLKVIDVDDLDSAPTVIEAEVSE